MPTITPGKTTNPIQPNATSLDQNRRNWQRLSQGGATGTIAVDAPITNSGGAIGLAFDTSVFSVNGSGQLALAILTAKGDLLTRTSTADTRLPVGTTNGYVLSVDSAAATGLAWLPPSGGGGGTGTIAQVLTAGNDAANLTLTDLGTLNANSVINMASGGAYEYNGVAVITAQTALGNFYFASGGNFTATGQQNIGVGPGTLTALTTGQYNFALGDAALNVNTTGQQNVAIGAASLNSNTTGSFNVAVGTNALNANISGGDNVAFGQSALADNTTGSGNFACGINALANNTTGDNNVAIGIGASQGSTTASQNIAIGANALQGGASGSNNTVIGYNSTTVLTGSNNTIIGANVGNQTITDTVILADGTGTIRLQIGTVAAFNVLITTASLGTGPASSSTYLRGDQTWATIPVVPTFVDKEIPSGAINGSNTIFTLANTPTSGSEQIVVNGLMLYPGSGNDYTISGNTITFLTGAIPQTGDRLFVNYRH